MGAWQVMAAEMRETLPANAHLALSAPRIAWLGLGDTAMMLAASSIPLADLLHAAKLPHHPPVSAVDEAVTLALDLLTRAGLLPAAMLWPSTQPGVNLASVQAYLAATPRLTRVTQAQLPLAVAENTRVIAYRDAAGAEHLALLIGTPEQDTAPLTRLHSSCLTGDLLGSLRCDCGDQLHAALHHMADAGSGILLYLQQEGRGIGLVNKLRAYALQEQGLDTVEANGALGFSPDGRDFALAAAILKDLNVGAIRLLTNNPAKMAALQAAGITVSERIALRPAEGGHNHAYLATKRTKMGHWN